MLKRVCLIISDGSEHLSGRCSVSISGCVWNMGLMHTESPDCRTCTNLRRLRKSKASLPKRSTVCCTPSVNWMLTWTGAELKFQTYYIISFTILIKKNVNVFQVCGYNTVPALSAPFGGHDESRKALLLFSVSQD